MVKADRLDEIVVEIDELGMPTDALWRASENIHTGLSAVKGACA